jgi:hypothetical protein
MALTDPRIARWSRQRRRRCYSNSLLCAFQIGQKTGDTLHANCA